MFPAVFWMPSLSLDSIACQTAGVLSFRGSGNLVVEIRAQRARGDFCVRPLMASSAAFNATG